MAQSGDKPMEVEEGELQKSYLPVLCVSAVSVNIYCLKKQRIYLWTCTLFI